MTYNLQGDRPSWFAQNRGVNWDVGISALKPVRSQANPNKSAIIQCASRQCGDRER